MRRLWYNATVASMDGNMNAYQPSAQMASK